MGPGGHFGPPGFMFGMIRRPESVEDRHVIAKHTEICLEESELENIHKLVLQVEKALKEVSDELTKDGEEIKDEESQNGEDRRILKNVIRVGVLAKGLVLRDDNQFRLVVLCCQKPTVLLVKKIVTLLPTHLEKINAEETFIVEEDVGQAGFVVKCKLRTGENEKEILLNISVTSPLMREDIKDSSDNETSTDHLDSEKCLEALATLRHAKWFQARAQCRHSCVMIIRILRDLCQRVTCWKHMSLFSIELLVEKVLASAGVPLTPGDALRRVFEAIAGGILFEESPGILDPCEKERQDVCKNLTSQQREDITANAQQCLRQIAFRQCYKVLGMEPLPVPKHSRSRMGSGGIVAKRKRRLDEEESVDSVKIEGEQEEKKVKQEDVKQEQSDQ